MYCILLEVGNLLGPVKATVVRPSRYRCQPRHVDEVRTQRISARVRSRYPKWKMNDRQQCRCSKFTKVMGTWKESLDIV